MSRTWSASSWRSTACCCWAVDMLEARLFTAWVRLVEPELFLDPLPRDLIGTYDATFDPDYFRNLSLMFAFKVQGAIIRSVAAERAGHWVRTAGDRTRKTPVEQALMRGLATA